uniref:MAPK regulated corepressor interacting protein 2 n=1 Tax=Ciona savignyi TaxID=51511 RepID=H2YYJ0_CIOSA
MYGIGNKPQNKHKTVPSLRHADKISPTAERDSQWATSGMGVQKLHFNNSGKRTSRSNSMMSNTLDPITQQHEENVTALSDEWEKVKADLNRNEEQKTSGTIQYVERHQNPNMADFQPFDLEQFWGQRILSNVN